MSSKFDLCLLLYVIRLVGWLKHCKLSLSLAEMVGLMDNDQIDEFTIRFCLQVLLILPPNNSGTAQRHSRAAIHSHAKYHPIAKDMVGRGDQVSKHGRQRWPTVQVWDTELTNSPFNPEALMVMKAKHFAVAMLNVTSNQLTEPQETNVCLTSVLPLWLYALVLWYCWLTS